MKAPTTSTAPKRKRKPDSARATPEDSGGIAAAAAPEPEAIPSPTATIASDAVPAKSPAAEPGGDAPVEITPEEIRQDEAVVERVEHLAKDVAWVLIAAGVIGVVMPGVLGTPFLIAGAAALWPGNRKRLEQWRQGHSPKFFHGGMRQINRFLDDLERRYPRDNGKR